MVFQRNVRAIRAKIRGSSPGDRSKKVLISASGTSVEPGEYTLWSGFQAGAKWQATIVCHSQLHANVGEN